MGKKMLDSGTFDGLQTLTRQGIMEEFDFVKEIDDIFPGKSEGVRKNKLESNRLAFLAVTSKCEVVIRDEIAFRLQEKHLKSKIQNEFSPNEYYVAREWTENR